MNVGKEMKSIANITLYAILILGLLTGLGAITKTQTTAAITPGQVSCVEIDRAEQAQ